MSKSRAPKFMGTGIYVHQQFRPKQLVKGDTFFDADYGLVRWTGKKWKQVKEKVNQPIDKDMVIIVSQEGKMHVFANHGPHDYHYDTSEATPEELDYLKACVKANKWL